MYDCKVRETREPSIRHAWKACLRETLPCVRIPLSPPNTHRATRRVPIYMSARQGRNLTGTLRLRRMSVVLSSTTPRRLLTPWLISRHRSPLGASAHTSPLSGGGEARDERTPARRRSQRCRAGACACRARHVISAYDAANASTSWRAGGMHRQRNVFAAAVVPDLCITAASP